MAKTLYTLTAFFCLCATIATTPLAAQDFYDSSRVQEIKLYFTQPNWRQLLNTAAASTAEPYTFCRRVVVNGVNFDSVGAKFKGNSSFSATRIKNPWHIELDYIKNQDYQGYKDIKLSNVIFDGSFVREALSYELLQPYMHAPRANFTRVWVNDTLQGLYTNVEAVTKTFAKKHFPSSDNHVLVKGTPPSLGGASGGSSLAYLGTDSSLYTRGYEILSDYGWKELVNLCDTLNNKTADVEKILDVDRALWMLGFNVLFVNLDSYTGGFTQNYYLWRDDTRRFSAIAWDLNMSFGAFTNVGAAGVGTDSLSLAKLSPFVHETNAAKPLISKLLANPRYKKMLIAHIRTFYKEQFKTGRYKTRGEALRTLIADFVAQDPNKLTTLAQFNTNFYYGGAAAGQGGIGVVTLVENKVKYLDTLAAMIAVPPTISNIVAPTNAKLNDSVYISAKVVGNSTEGVFLGYRQSNRQAFQRILMYDDGLHRDGAANDGVFAVGFKAISTSIEYYIWAENANAGIFSPERAEHEFYSVKIQAPASVINSGDLVINEIMADNTKTAKNNNGDFDDWIELHNRTSQAISLVDAFISDSKTNRKKWKFPQNYVVPPNGYFIVWADDDSTNTETQYAHTNFKLSASGETITLSNAQGALLDSVVFTKQGIDTSWARIPNGTGPFRRVLPTFSAPNVVTSTQDFADATKLLIFPNPTENVLYIASTDAQHPLSNLRVYNSLGQMMKQVQLIDNQQFALDVSDLSAGIYFLKIGNWGLRKVLIER